ncbi:MAG: DUF4175 family protein, partial [Tistlia sp.]
MIRPGQAAGRERPGAPEPGVLARGYRLRLGLSRAALFWESLWPALWPLGGIAGLFLALALMDALAELDGWLHLAVLAGFSLAALAALAWAVRRVRLPRREAARRRLERDSGFEHRPLQALEDSLATPGDDATTADGGWRGGR